MPTSVWFTHAQVSSHPYRLLPEGCVNRKRPGPRRPTITHYRMMVALLLSLLGSLHFVRARDLDGKNIAILGSSGHDGIATMLSARSNLPFLLFLLFRRSCRLVGQDPSRSARSLCAADCEAPSPPRPRAPDPDRSNDRVPPFLRTTAQRRSPAPGLGASTSGIFAI